MCTCLALPGATCWENSSRALVPSEVNERAAGTAAVPSACLHSLLEQVTCRCCPLEQLVMPIETDIFEAVTVRKGVL